MENYKCEIADECGVRKQFLTINVSDDIIWSRAVLCLTVNQNDECPWNLISIVVIILVFVRAFSDLHKS